MTELDKNVLTEIEKNKKVEVVVKRDAAAEGTELDLVRVFSNMGKKKRVYAWLVLFCMLVGLAVPLLRAEMAESTESVSAVISFIYPGAKDGLAPDRTTLDVNYVTSSYILQSAMARTHLSASIPVNALERNISIERLLTEETRQNLEVVEKVISEANKDYEKVKEVRNILEHNSFRPIMFFLKCLADDDEIDALIKREIDSRERFILCNSENDEILNGCRKKSNI